MPAVGANDGGRTLFYAPEQGAPENPGASFIANYLAYSTANARDVYQAYLKASDPNEMLQRLSALATIKQRYLDSQNDVERAEIAADAVKFQSRRELLKSIYAKDIARMDNEGKIAVANTDADARRDVAGELSDKAIEMRDRARAEMRYGAKLLAEGYTEEGQDHIDRAFSTLARESEKLRPAEQGRLRDEIVNSDIGLDDEDPVNRWVHDRAVAKFGGELKRAPDKRYGVGVSTNDELMGDYSRVAGALGDDPDETSRRTETRTKTTSSEDSQAPPSRPGPSSSARAAPSRQDAETEEPTGVEADRRYQEADVPEPGEGLDDEDETEDADTDTDTDSDTDWIDALMGATVTRGNPFENRARSQSGGRRTEAERAQRQSDREMKRAAKLVGPRTDPVAPTYGGMEKNAPTNPALAEKPIKVEKPEPEPEAKTVEDKAAKLVGAKPKPKLDQTDKLLKELMPEQSDVSLLSPEEQADLDELERLEEEERKRTDKAYSSGRGRALQ